MVREMPLVYDRILCFRSPSFFGP